MTNYETILSGLIKKAHPGPAQLRHITSLMSSHSAVAPRSVLLMEQKDWIIQRARAISSERSARSAVRPSDAARGVRRSGRILAAPLRRGHISEFRYVPLRGQERRRPGGVEAKI